ncbi:hypothetical protein [Chitinophaga nivalis]|uniref:DUF4595 domain-containing protein n=1 Tax=Chitinophaga nivalis TaxID=2991709 RepID=A0ABT3IWV1_9BACT|nr:hypothetical protein [Chitinophaga nivalis]MCW3461933.1 hypothetical protein [Chitinophaga nivalis]MCW3488376.1 hypothetical protein [Chitinophaga nivalis]
MKTFPIMLFVCSCLLLSCQKTTINQDFTFQSTKADTTWLLKKITTLNLKSVVEATTTFTYNNANQLISKVTVTPGVAGIAIDSFPYVYNATGQLIRFTHHRRYVGSSAPPTQTPYYLEYDNQNRLRKANTIGNDSITYTYRGDTSVIARYEVNEWENWFTYTRAEYMTYRNGNLVQIIRYSTTNGDLPDTADHHPTLLSMPLYDTKPNFNTSTNTALLKAAGFDLTSSMSFAEAEMAAPYRSKNNFLGNSPYQYNYTYNQQGLPTTIQYLYNGRPVLQYKLEYVPAR